MNHTVVPIKGTLDAVVRLPGSKSITNRALVAAALASGTSELHSVGIGDDTRAMISVIEALGVEVELDGTTAVVHGRSGSLDAGAVLDARQSGTTARFSIPLLLLAGGGSIDGHDQMRARPMAELVNALRHLGAEVDGESLPLTISAPDSIGDTVRIPATVSSQFVSALLLAGPALPDGLLLTLDGVPVSPSYIHMTLAVMRSFGAEVEHGADRIRVAPTGYSPAVLTIEPDASTATYPLAAAAMVGGRVRVEGLGRGSVQSDIGFGTILERMGADCFVEDDFIEVRGSGSLRAASVDLGDMSDSAPTFGAVAARARGTSHATGIGFIRTTKESDRVAATVTELNRLGIVADIEDDGFRVTGGPHRHETVETYDDHRMAMALSLLGLVDEPVTIADPGCVAKTYPGFFELLDQFRASARVEPLVLAIDGPAGSGKSTVAAAVAEALRLPHLDTGAMYRSVALLAVRAGLDPSDAEAVIAATRAAEIDVDRSGVRIDGEDVTAAIRGPDVTALVSPVATIGEVRQHLVSQQRRWARARGAAVVEGRDIGSTVFPEATLKVYLTASVEERARRRSAELGSDDLVEMERRIRERDDIDSNREHDPLTIADGAEVIDSSSLDVNDVVRSIVAKWTREVER